MQGPQNVAGTLRFFRRSSVAAEGIPADAGFIPDCQLGQSEIKNLGVAALGYKNVCRFNVAMNDAVGVGSVEDSAFRLLRVTTSRNTLAMKLFRCASPTS